MEKKTIKIKPVDASTPQITLGGITYDYFCGCGYHDLQDSPELRQAVSESLKSLPFKQGAAHYGYGNNPILDQFVQTASKFFHTETVLTYPSGYLGNAILFRALRDKYDKVFVDDESHYSMKDALALVDKPVITFSHLDPEDLSQKIQKNLRPNEKPLITSDGVFPFSGEIAPIPEYLKIIENIDGAIVSIDDSHGTGVLGKNGRGTYEYYDLESPNLYYCGTMSKAFGSHGGIIPCSQEFYDNIVKNSYIMKGSTELPNPTLAASIKAMEILMNNPLMFQNLWDNALYLKRGFKELGFSIKVSPTGMLCLGKFNNIDLPELYNFYKENRILPNYAPDGSYTSVPKGGGIKFTIFSNHSKSQFDRVLSITKLYLEKKGILKK
ncbi:MAG: aminotransferase class I/II-fold pyridoxal phosphate-dependent enzyme [Promethearchaeota archaeon]